MEPTFATIRLRTKVTRGTDWQTDSLPQLTTITAVWRQRRRSQQPGLAGLFANTLRLGMGTVWNNPLTKANRARMTMRWLHEPPCHTTYGRLEFTVIG
ncbi:hypothetical protein [Streptomyces mirabilis]|jgi:hypothetical protein|uniref:hypothetical protein n=1 Tax=Streptomyces mirabilis TaxID=68239 RepID=UPI0033B4549A